MSGWVANQLDPGRPVLVELMVDGELVDRTTANLPRSDLEGLGLGHSNYEFRFTLPDRRLSVLPEVRVAGTGQVLAILEQAPACEGVVETLSWSRLSGWAWRVGLPDVTLELDVLVGGHLLRKVTAGTFRQDLADNGIGRGAHYFTCSLAGLLEREAFRAEDVQVLFPQTRQPLPILSGAVATVAIPPGAAPTRARAVRQPRQAAADVLELVRPDVADAAVPALAAELVCERGLLRGWVHNRATGQPEWVEVSLDDEVIWCGEARRLETVALSGGETRLAAGAARAAAAARRLDGHPPCRGAHRRRRACAGQPAGGAVRRSVSR